MLQHRHVLDSPHGSAQSYLVSNANQELDERAHTFIGFVGGMNVDRIRFWSFGMASCAQCTRPVRLEWGKWEISCFLFRLTCHNSSHDPGIVSFYECLGLGIMILRLVVLPSIPARVLRRVSSSVRGRVPKDEDVWETEHQQRPELQLLRTQSFWYPMA